MLIDGDPNRSVCSYMYKYATKTQSKQMDDEFEDEFSAFMEEQGYTPLHPETTKQWPFFHYGCGGKVTKLKPWNLELPLEQR